jgi:hypothetical protein
LARFVEKVDYLSSPAGCWEWTGYIDEKGYGKFNLPNTYQPVRAHRYAYELAVGPIPKGMHIHHKCNNEKCVNPNHLEPTTPSDHVFLTPGNVAYEAALKTHCPKGHEYSRQNTRIEKVGWRKCKQCYSDMLAERLAAYREEHPVAPPKILCSKGHLLDGDNLYVKGDGSRHCKMCSAESQRLYRARKAAGINVERTHERTHCPKGHEFTEQNTSPCVEPPT